MTPGYEALRTHAAWLDLSARGRIYVTGEDRARLLHALLTNHVLQLQPGDGCYAFFLNAQGHIQADVNVLCLADRFLLDTEPETRERLFRHIDKYIIADDVTLEDVTEPLASIALEGPRAAAILETLGAPVPHSDYAHAAWNGAIVQRAGSIGAPGFRIFVPVGRKAAAIATLESAGALPATPQGARIVRVENGQPRYGEDIFDTTLPQETGQMHAVHFAKGCYLGQEIVERIRSRGHVNRSLEKLELDGQVPPQPGAKITTAGGESAEITSAVWSPALGKVVALAYVRRSRAFD